MILPKTAAAGICGLAAMVMLGGCSIPFDSPLGGEGRTSQARPAPVSQSESQPAAEAEGVRGPVTRFEGDWADEEGRPVSRRDAESCYAAANALVDRDQRIDRDVGSVDSTATWGADASLMDSMRSYGNESRRLDLYAECLRSRGYRRY